MGSVQLLASYCSVECGFHVPRREDDIGRRKLDVPQKPAELSWNHSVTAASTPSGHILKDTDGRPAVSGSAPPARSQNVSQGG